MRIQFRLDLQADKSSIAKGPFFPQVWTQGIKSVEQMYDARTYLLKPRTLRSSKGVLLHLSSMMDPPTDASPMHLQSHVSLSATFLNRVKAWVGVSSMMDPPTDASMIVLDAMVSPW
jgi:hypothetical protein